MAVGLIITIILSVCILAGIFIWIISSGKTPKTIPVPMNSKILWNPVKSRWTDGYRELSIMEMRENNNETTYIKGYPRDNEQGEKGEKIQIQEFVVSTSNLIPLGDKKGRREIYLLVSEDSTDYPDGLKNTMLHNVMKNAGMQGYLNDTFGESIREMNQAVAENIIRLAGGEVTDIVLDHEQEKLKKLRQMSESFSNSTNTQNDEKK